MPELNTSQWNILKKRVINFDMNYPKERLEDFISKELNFNPQQRDDYLPDPDPNGYFAIIKAKFTKTREDIIVNDLSIPSFSIYEENNNTYISGLREHLKNSSKNISSAFLHKLSFHKEIKSKIQSLSKGHYLEALSAQILSEKYKNSSFATRGSGDQGIDVISSFDFINFDEVLLNESIASIPSTFDKVFVLGSSKHNEGNDNSTIAPAHIRELIGGWLIQRSDSGLWKTQKIKFLSPIQLLLISTYRLSDESWKLCIELGVKVWSIPELIYNVCLYSPDSIFNANKFDNNEFDKWWEVADKNRISS